MISQLSHLPPPSEYSLHIGGSRRQSRTGKRFSTANPCTAEIANSYADAAAEDVADGVTSARAALNTAWAHVPGSRRGALMLRLADLVDEHAQRLGSLETLENGKLLAETTSQAHFAARCFRYFAGYADKVRGDVIPLDDGQVLDFLVREPVGVCALFIAWNSPLQLLANKLAPALAAGNTVVIKPSEYACASLCELADLVNEAGFPEGVVNIVTGSGSVAGAALAENPDVDLVSLTGGVSTGRIVGRAAVNNLARLVLELGGKSPNIVFGDAGLERAVDGIIAGIFAAAGQTCIAGSRLLVERSIADTVIDHLLHRIQDLRLGDPTDPASNMGPLANRPQFDRVSQFVQRGRGDGASLLAGGEVAHVPNLPRGLFFQPTVFLDDANATSVAREEVFGPVLTVMRFDDDDHAVALANDSAYGLAAGVWTNDISRAHRVVRQLRAGTVWVNTYRAVSPAAPFGGYRGSGVGRERGLEGLLEFTQLKNVMVDFGQGERNPFVIRN